MWWGQIPQMWSHSPDTAVCMFMFVCLSVAEGEKNGMTVTEKKKRMYHHVNHSLPGIQGPSNTFLFNQCGTQEVKA